MIRKPKAVVITFDENGDPSVEAVGYAGRACLTATEEIERALGMHSTTRTTTPDMRRVEKERGNVRTR